MTDRAITAGIIAEADSAVVLQVHFVEMLFPTVSRVWTGLGPKTATMPGESSQTWDGIGDLGSIENINEDTSRKRNGVLFNLSGVNSALFTTALDEEYSGKDITVWEAYLNTNGAIISDPFIVFSGLMSTLGIADGDPTGILKLQAESREVLLQRTSRSLLTDQEQQRIFPGDLGLEFLAGLQAKQIIWGEATASESGGSTGGGGGGAIGGNTRR